jgi:MFS family permease
MKIRATSRALFHRWFPNTEQRNLALNIFDGSLYQTSAAFISVPTVLPAIVARFGGSNVEVGAISVIAYVGVFFPQLFAARYVETLPWKKPWAITMGTAQRFVILAIGVLILAFGGSSPRLALWGFLVLYALNQILAGVCTPGWFDLFAKLTAPKKRGRLVGIRNAIGGMGAFLAGFILIALLAWMPFPYGYAASFFLAFFLQMGSIRLQAKLVEAEPSKTVPQRSIMEFVRHIPEVLRHNHEFSRFLVGSGLLTLSTIPTGFFTVYVLRDFQAGESVVGQFTLAMVVSQAVGSLVVGYISDRLGNRFALLSSAYAMFFATAVALVAPSPGWFMIVYMFVGVYLGTEMMARFNMSIEYGTPEQRSTYVGITNTLLAPLYLASIAGGAVSDAFGYRAVFILGIVFSVAAILVLIARVRDPRTLPRPADSPLP